MTTNGPKTEGGVTRKGFIDWVLGTSIGGFMAAVAYPVVRYWIPPEVPESAVNSVILPFATTELPRNSGRIFKFGSKPGLLVHTAEGEYRAFSARCTHLDCTVQYRDDLSHIWCACHNGHFDVNGGVLSGPPPSPLDGFDVNVRGEQIVVSLRT